MGHKESNQTNKNSVVSLNTPVFSQLEKSIALFSEKTDDPNETLLKAMCVKALFPPMRPKQKFALHQFLLIGLLEQ